MTPKEALQETHRRREIAGMTAESDVVEYYSIIADALNRQIPKKPHKNRLKYYCPFCNTCVGKNHIDGRKTRKAYCFACGGAIDWTENEE